MYRMWATPERLISRLPKLQVMFAHAFYDSVIFFRIFGIHIFLVTASLRFREMKLRKVQRLASGSRGDTVLGNSRSDRVGQSIILRHRGCMCLTAHWFSPFSVAVVNFGPDFIQGEH